MEKNMQEQQKIDPKAQENQSRRIGLEDRLREPVKNTQHNQKALDAARNARFTSTGEPSEAPSAVDSE
jgi:hypothetical protein